ncbi:MAG: gliding motility lipoprotein GldD [Bacteroidota bacterium]
MNFRLLLGFMVLFTLAACGDSDDATIPKPKGYFRVTFPTHAYKPFEPAACPYSFDISTNAVAIPDTNDLSEPFWYYIVMPKLNGQIYLTYKTLNNDFGKFAEDTRTLVYKHTSRASSINENVIQVNDRVGGILYEIGGDAASPIQFFVTDSTKHFLRGALYFNAAPNADSIAPSVKYAKEDIMQMIKTLKWK